MKLSKKYNESIHRQKKQEELIEKINKEKIKLKKELIESNFERKNFESQLNNQVDEVKKLRLELKAKGNMIVTLENSRRKLEVEMAKSGIRSAPCPRVFRSRNDSGNGMRQRSYSVDRLNEQNKHFGRQLLKSGQSSAYSLSKKGAGGGTKATGLNVTSTTGLDNDIDTFEKVILLQKLLLSKTKLLTEKEVKIEELERQNNEMTLIVSRLKGTRHLAQELTDTRHRLAIKTNQLEVSNVLSKDGVFTGRMFIPRLKPLTCITDALNVLNLIENRQLKRKWTQ